MNKDIEIMDMPSGTKLRNKRNDVVYTLGDWCNERARILTDESVLIEPFRTDYINRNVQNDYEVVESECTE